MGTSGGERGGLPGTGRRTSIPLLPDTALPSTSIFRSIIVHSWVFFFFSHSFPEKTRSDSSGKTISSPPELVREGHACGQIDKK